MNSKEQFRAAYAAGREAYRQRMEDRPEWDQNRPEWASFISSIVFMALIALPFTLFGFPTTILSWVGRVLLMAASAPIALRAISLRNRWRNHVAEQSPRRGQS